MPGGISGSLDSERALRSALDGHERRLRQVADEDVIIGDGRRLIIRSPNGHFWNIGVSNAGALTLTDMGTSL